MFTAGFITGFFACVVVIAGIAANGKNDGEGGGGGNGFM